MPHIVVEYSANLEPDVDVAALLKAVHGAALDTGIFPLGGIRVRARRCTDFLIADGNPAHAFVHVTAKIGHGRDAGTKRAAGELIFAALSGFLRPIFERRTLGISFEMTELDADLSFKLNNIHDYLKAQAR
jgi:5-carboxymethyl-2-hydroxymuconate isomerase